jgi:hypothetical protein
MADVFRADVYQFEVGNSASWCSLRAEPTPSSRPRDAWEVVRGLAEPLASTGLPDQRGRDLSRPDSPDAAARHTRSGGVRCRRSTSRIDEDLTPRHSSDRISFGSTHPAPLHCLARHRRADGRSSTRGPRRDRLRRLAPLPADHEQPTARGRRAAPRLVLLGDSAICARPRRGHARAGVDARAAPCRGNGAGNRRRDCPGDERDAPRRERRPG